jgi:hypothetical protein
VTGELGTYVPLVYALLHAPDKHVAEALEKAAVRGVLVPPGMVAVNHDDLALIVDVLDPACEAMLTYREKVALVARLRAVLAASNPTTETKPDA